MVMWRLRATPLYPSVARSPCIPASRDATGGAAMLKVRCETSRSSYAMLWEIFEGEDAKCQKRPNSVKRDLIVSNETEDANSQKRPN
jgi:hypothetical protein